MCIVAGAGVGKTSVALDVGSRLWQGGHIPGGARFVDMREARTVDDVLGRFCKTLEIKQVSKLLTSHAHLVVRFTILKRIVEIILSLFQSAGMKFTN